MSWKGVQKLRVESETMTLYAVTDSAWVGKQTLMEQVKDALDGGITFLQLREKELDHAAFLEEAKEMAKLSRQYGVPFVINDEVEIALESGAGGVHVGQDDMACRNARKLLGPDKIIGVSVHNVEEALKAQDEGADYLGLGAVKATPTKTDARVVDFEEIKKVCDAVSIPVVAIGGIKKDNLMELEGSHVDGIAVVSAIFGAGDIMRETKELRKKAEEMKKR